VFGCIISLTSGIITWIIIVDDDDDVLVDAIGNVSTNIIVIVAVRIIIDVGFGIFIVVVVIIVIVIVVIGKGSTFCLVGMIIIVGDKANGPIIRGFR